MHNLLHHKTPLESVQTQGVFKLFVGALRSTLRICRSIQVHTSNDQGDGQRIAIDPNIRRESDAFGEMIVRVEKHAIAKPKWDAGARQCRIKRRAFKVKESPCVRSDNNLNSPKN